MKEWKKLIYPGIPNGKNRFLISSCGELMNEKSGKIYKQETLRTGYQSVRVGFGRYGRLSIIIHKAVACTFIPNPEHMPMINHKDGDKTNNRVDNLEWCTCGYNVKHAYDNGLIKKQIGEKNHQSKLKESDVIEIRNQYKSGSNESSMRALAKKYGVSRNVILKIIHRETWKNVG